MIFDIYGLVKHKGRKIANGIDGRFETDNETTIALLTQKGFTAIQDAPAPRKLGRPYKNQSKESK